MANSAPLRPSGSASLADDALGRRLVASGRITPQQLAACLHHQRASGSGATRLGELLVALGLVGESELRQTLYDMVEAGPDPGSGSGSWGASPRPPSHGGAGVPAAPAPPPAGAAQLGRYVLQAELGRGGMGVVYRAHDPALDRAVAIKVLGVGLDGGAVSDAQLRRFEREARTAARLRHPGIVAVHEVGWSPPGPGAPARPYLVMDLVRGESLEALLRRESPAPRRIAAIVRSVALALSHAHGEGVVHRDVKPENVLVEPGESGRVFLTDFGLAREAEAGERLTVSGQLLGTPAYMAPEQASPGRAPIGPATDVYALGGVLYRALTGRPPFEDEQLVALLRRLMFEEPTPPRRINPQVHPDLETIALRCLEKEPARRYADAGALADELERFGRGEPIHARPIGRLERSMRWARRNRLLAAALGTIGALVLAAGIAGVAMLAELRRRVAAERASVVAGAADRAASAWAALETARAQPATGGEEAARARRDALLARGLEAMQAASAHRALAPDDEIAAGRAFSATVAYGELALQAEQWAVAKSAFEAAAAIGEDDARARALIARVDVERRRVADEHRRVVEQVIADARSGALAARPDGREDALFTLVRYPEAQTVALLGAALDEVSERLREVFRAAYLEAARPDDAAGASAGQAEIGGLAEVLDRWLTVDTGPSLDEATTAALRQAMRRLEEREMRRRTRRQREGGAHEEHERPTAPRTAPEIVAAEQARRVGDRELLLARLCCEALGRIGIREGAIAPLGRYLWADSDQTRAATAGVALCLLGGAQAEEIVVAARRRFGVTGPFWRQVGRMLERVQTETPLDAETAEGYRARALTRTTKGDHEGAIEDLTRAIELEPDDAEAWVNRGAARSMNGDARGAVADLTRAIELAPAFAEAWSNRGNLRHQLGDIDGAIADLTRAIELAPTLAMAWTNRGNARKETEPEAAIADLTRAVELDPSLAQAWASRGDLRAKTGDLAGGVDDLSRAVGLDPGEPQIWAALGLVRRLAGDATRAVEACSRAIELDPDCGVAWLERGLARQDLGDLDGALADLERAVELDPDDPGPWNNRGNVRGALGDIEGAIADYSHGIELAPRSVPAWYNRGNARRIKGDLRGAMEDYSRAIELDPELAPAWSNRAVVRFGAHDMKGAIADWSRAIEIDPRNPSAWANRGNARRLAGDLEGSKADLARAIELAPGLTGARVNLAMTLEQAGDRPAAIAELSAAIEADPRYALAWMMRGYARRKAGDAAGAVADLERFLELAPDLPEAPEVRRALSELRAGR